MSAVAVQAAKQIYSTLEQTTNEYNQSNEQTNDQTGTISINQSLLTSLVRLSDLDEDELRMIAIQYIFLDQTLDRLFGCLTDCWPQPINQSNNESNNQSINQTRVLAIMSLLGLLARQPEVRGVIHRRILPEESDDESDNESNDQPENKSSNESTKQSTNQSTEQLDILFNLFNWLIDCSDDCSVHHIVCQSIAWICFDPSIELLSKLHSSGLIDRLIRMIAPLSDNQSSQASKQFEHLTSDHSNNQTDSQSSDETNKQTIDQSITQSLKQSIIEPATVPTINPVILRVVLISFLLTLIQTEDEEDEDEDEEESNNQSTDKSIKEANNQMMRRLLYETRFLTRIQKLVCQNLALLYDLTDSQIQGMELNQPIDQNNQSIDQNTMEYLVQQSINQTNKQSNKQSSKQSINLEDVSQLLQLCLLSIHLTGSTYHLMIGSQTFVVALQSIKHHYAKIDAVNQTIKQSKSTKKQKQSIKRAQFDELFESGKIIHELANQLIDIEFNERNALEQINQMIQAQSLGQSNSQSTSQSNDPPTIHYREDECSGCYINQSEAPAKFKLCSACHSARYCSAKCQKSHWKEHKVHCKRK